MSTHWKVWFGGISILCIAIFLMSISSAHGQTLGEAVENTGLKWETGGDAKWFGQNNTTACGENAVQSGDISDNQNTWIQTTIIGPGILHFNWKVYSWPEDGWLKLYIDDEMQERISGYLQWQHKSCAVGPGSHKARWEYAKDSHRSIGSDCGWLDKVEFIPFSPPGPPSPSVSSDTSSFSIQEGQAKRITFHVRNRGGASTSKSYLSITVSNGLEIGDYHSSLPSMIFANYPPGYDSIYTCNGSTKYSEYQLLDASTSHPAGGGATVTIIVIGRSPGPQWIKYRAAFSDGMTYYRDPISGNTDQQDCFAYTISGRVDGSP